MGYRNSFQRTTHARKGNARREISHHTTKSLPRERRSWPTAAKTPLPVRRPEPVQQGNWFTDGGWYPLVTLPTLGFASWIPFTNAAHRLDSTGLVFVGAGYSLLPIVSIGLIGASPMDAVVVPMIGILLTLVGMVAGATHLLVLSTRITARRKGIAPKPRTRKTPKKVEAPPKAPRVDPALARALDARQKRAAARELARTDPLLAQDLHIGRPDLGIDYDDGGLIDVNSAPAATIASAFHLKLADAQRLVEQRARRGGFTSVDEMLVLVDLPVSAWDRIRDRGVTLSA